MPQAWGILHLKHSLPRSIDVVSLVDTFVVSAVSSLMLVRLYLFLAGYPQVGGGGLHVAHMIWGGLLMLTALIIGISFISIASRRATALFGGLGFGLFIDEIGKFLTSDNNYFFRPAAALIYLVFMVIFLFSRMIVRRQGFSSEEYLANAIDILKEAATHDVDQLERRRILHLLTQAGPSTLADGIHELVKGLPPAKKLSSAQRARRALERGYDQIASRTWFHRLLAAFVLAGSTLAIVEIIVIVIVRNDAWSWYPSDAVAGVSHLSRTFNFVDWLELAAACAAFALAAFGLAIGTGKARGLRMLERSVFIWILLIQPFAFYEAQFFASAGLIFSLPLLAVIQYSSQRETRREAGRA